ncbi:MAG: hypothetical protein HYT80_03340 [Euryarchaeota archaeon]|nr:hypothetical protein [Euryarchaeota archaeon]
MSEVVGYLLGFGMSFMLLMMALYAFAEVEDQSAESANKALFKDVAGRVAAGVLEMTEVARGRVDSSLVTSEQYVVAKTLPIPRDIRGLTYVIKLEEKLVTVQDINGRFTETATTLNFDFEDHTTANSCSNVGYPLCYVGGEVRSERGRILIKYEYDETTGTVDTCSTTPYWNCITIS